jgi:hypothetical protein
VRSRRGCAAPAARSEGTVDAAVAVRHVMCLPVVSVRAPVVLFNAAQVLCTLMTSLGVESKALTAALFALGVTMHDRAHLFRKL